MGPPLGLGGGAPWEGQFASPIASVGMEPETETHTVQTQAAEMGRDPINISVCVPPEEPRMGIRERWLQMRLEHTDG